MTSGRRTLAEVRAKSTPTHDPERLTEHSRTVRDAVGQIRDRIGSSGILADVPSFWSWVSRAGLLHDSGKVAEGFQQQLLPGGEPWGERHEVLSLAYVDLLASACGWTQQDRLLTAVLVATHHRPLFPDGGQGRGSKRSLVQQYNEHTLWEDAFTRRPRLDTHQVQVRPDLHRELLAWFCGALEADPPLTIAGSKLAHRARDLLAELVQEWKDPVDPHRGLVAVLAQGALTLADHTGSAHVAPQSHLPLPDDYLARLERPYPHQRLAAETDGHLVLIAPTGSGKTEAGLAWAGRQVRRMPGQPRMVWVLPYRASIDAAAQRFRNDLDPPPGGKEPDIGVLHGTVAQTLLAQAIEDECPCTDNSADEPRGPAQRVGPPAPAEVLARQAQARANVMRLFAQRVRVSTPHQLLRGAIAGPSHSSALLEQANCTFVLDELHAYDPVTFGRLCSAMGLWERMGSRVAVLSATLAPPMTQLIEESLNQPITVHRAAPDTSPERHRLVLDHTTLTDPTSLARLVGWLQAGHSVLVVANTVATAQHVYETLAPAAREACPGDAGAALLLHSRFKNRDRAAIERRLSLRHGERRSGETARRGGVVVATQTVEVSLCLDFDRGAVEAAPVEAVAQRAGRVNRRGRHPEGVVEFRVHRPRSTLPYPAPAVDAAWHALTTLTSHGTSTLSEQHIDQLLAMAYDTEWGERWAKKAREARDHHTTEFLTFDEPFRDRGEFARRLDEELDSTQVLHADDIDEFRQLSRDRQGHPLLAAGLLIPVRYGYLRQLDAMFDKSLNVFVTTAPYTSERGLCVPSATTPPPPPRETVL